MEIDFSKWQTRSKQFDIIVDLPHNYSFDNFNKDIVRVLSSLSSGGYLYFSALHDKDIYDNGELKPIHYHIVLVCSTRKRCCTIGYMLADMLQYDINCISVATVNNLALAVQYLIHKNDLDKYQYSFSIIKTNSKDSLSSLFATEITSLQVDERLLFHLVDTGYTPLEIMFKIGLGNYTNYRKVITELYSARDKDWEWEKLLLLYGDE